MPHGHIPLEALYRAPVVWVLMGQKAGDNSQVLALAEGAGWPFEVKRFVHQPYELATNLALGTTLAGLSRASPACSKRPGRTWCCLPAVATSRLPGGSATGPPRTGIGCDWCTSVGPGAGSIRSI